MRFVLDAHLSPALARWIERHGYAAEHVNVAGLTQASDRTIWSHAEMIGAVIITKDQDYALRRRARNAGPSIVWLRIGNLTTVQLLRWFDAHFTEICEALDRGEPIVDIG